MENIKDKYFELEQEQQELLDVLQDRLNVVDQALLDRVINLQINMNTLANGEEINESISIGQPIPKVILTEYLKEGVIVNPQDDVFVVGTKKGQSAVTDHPAVTLKALQRFA